MFHRFADSGKAKFRRVCGKVRTVLVSIRDRKNALICRPCGQSTADAPCAIRGQLGVVARTGWRSAEFFKTALSIAPESISYEWLATTTGRGNATAAAAPNRRGSEAGTTNPRPLIESGSARHRGNKAGKGAVSNGAQTHYRRRACNASKGVKILSRRYTTMMKPSMSRPSSLSR